MRGAILFILKSIVTIQSVILGGGVTGRRLLLRLGYLVVISVENDFVHFGHAGRSTVQF